MTKDNRIYRSIMTPLVDASGKEVGDIGKAIEHFEKYLDLKPESKESIEEVNELVVKLKAEFFDEEPEVNEESFKDDATLSELFESAINELETVVKALPSQLKGIFCQYPHCPKYGCNGFLLPFSYTNRNYEFWKCSECDHKVQKD